MYTLGSGQEVQLVLDVWEGQPEMDPAILQAGNVTGMFIRLNHTLGGHHKDALFDKTWALYKDFVRCPYFVYNPWVDGEANYKWLAANMPAEAPCVMADIEIPYSAVTAAQYGAEVADFVNLCNLKWKHATYTGEWFLEYITPWPKGDYWWAQYTRSMYPDTADTRPLSWSSLPRVPVTWDELRTLVSKTKWPPVNAARCPGTIKLWQCSGDKLVTPGSTRAMDINLFPGTVSDLRTWLGYSAVEPPVVELSDRERILRLEWAVQVLGISLDGWVP